MDKLEKAIEDIRKLAKQQQLKAGFGNLRWWLEPEEKEALRTVLEAAERLINIQKVAKKQAKIDHHLWFTHLDADIAIMQDAVKELHEVIFEGTKEGGE